MKVQGQVSRPNALSFWRNARQSKPRMRQHAHGAPGMLLELFP